MNQIKIEHQPNTERLQELGVTEWPIWSKEKSTFPWSMKLSWPAKAWQSSRRS